MVYSRRLNSCWVLIGLIWTPTALHAQTTNEPSSAVVLTTVNKKVDQRQVVALYRSLTAIHDSHPEQVDAAFSKVGVSVHQLLRAKSSDAIWASPAVQQKIQRVVTNNSPPQPIQNGKVLPPVDKAIIPIVPLLSTSDQALIVKLSSSVGRLELASPNGTKVLRGTAFVIGDDTVATNCHVISGESGAPLVDVSKLTVDFADSPGHTPQKEFAVIKSYPCPGRTGFDVAFLTVAPMSEDGSTPLPPALPLVKTRPQPITTSIPQPVWLIGYPDLPDADEPLYQHIEAASPGSYSQIFTPGMVESVESVNAPSGSPTFDVLLHIGSSDSGNSGSPVFGRNGQVLGIDHCCYDTLIRIPSSSLPLPCAWVYGQSRYNEAIAIWEVWTDPVLGPILKQVTHSM